jgi:Flp pilus assembly protein TadG
VTRARFAARLLGSRRGAAAVEFALLAPAFIVMLLGVLQVGIGMQNYNALRSVSADVSRYAMVQYATGNRLSSEQLRAYALATGISAPYLLDRSAFDAGVEEATAQRVSGATELTLRLDYQVPSLFSTMGLEGPYINYTRPIFVNPPPA